MKPGDDPNFRWPHTARQDNHVKLQQFVDDNIGVGELVFDAADLVVPKGQQTFSARQEDNVLLFIGPSVEDVIRRLQEKIVADQRVARGDVETIADMM